MSPTKKTVDLGRKLLEACLKGKLGAVEKCIEAGADPVKAVPYPEEKLSYPTEAAKVRLTPLRAAAHKGRYEVAKLLIEEYGAPTDERLYNLTLLHDAVSSRNLDLVRYLVDEHGLDVNERGYKERGAGAGGVTPLQLAMHADGVKALAMVAYLIERGADPNRKVHGGKLTALEYARKTRKPKIAAFLSGL